MPEHQQVTRNKSGILLKQQNAFGANKKTQAEERPAAAIQKARVNPDSLTVGDLHYLQRTIGNRAVGQLLSGLTVSKRHTIAIQRLNKVTAKTASNKAITDIDKDWGVGYTTLLSGWGTHHIAGHYGRSFTKKEREDIDNIGTKYGCCNCGSTVTKATHFTPDHEPPQSLEDGGFSGNFRFYAHCSDCSKKQAGVVATYKARMKKLRDGTDADWATGVQDFWFWN